MTLIKFLFSLGTSVPWQAEATGYLKSSCKELRPYQVMSMYSTILPLTLPMQCSIRNVPLMHVACFE